MKRNDPLGHVVCELSSNGSNLAKVIATFCVVLVHSYNLFGYAHIDGNNDYLLRGFRSLAGCGVPIFFLLSGYFMTRKDNWTWKDNLKKRVKSLIIPYCLFILCYTILNCLGYIVIPSVFENFRTFSVKDWFRHLIGYPFWTRPIFYDPCWFLRDLILLNFLTIILFPVVKKTPLYILLPAMLVLWLLPIAQYFRSSFSFFITGMRFGFKKKIPVVCNPFLMVILFTIGFLFPIAVSGDHIMRIAVLAMTYLVLSISEKLISFARFRDYTRVLIPYSFPVYSLHGLLLSLTQRIIVSAYSVNFSLAVFLYFVLPLIIIALCIVFAIFWKKLFPEVYTVFVGGR